MFYECVWEYADHKLVKRPDTSRYHITWCRKGSSRVCRKSTGTSDLDKAKEYLIDFASDRTTLKQKQETDPVLIDLLTSYVDRVAARSTRWVPEISALKHWTQFAELNDIVYVEELTRGMQERYVRWRLEEINRKGFKGSNGTLNRELRVMRAALNDAWKEEVLDRPPRMISLREPKYRQRFLFPEEVERLIQHCHAEYLYRFVMIALHTLQRPGAILSLHRDQVDLRAGLIDFLPEDEVQSRKRRPVVRISRVLRPILIQAMEESWTGHLIERNGRPVKSVRKGFNAARDAADLGREVTPYTLRHTGATLLLAAGVPIRQVSGMLGHAEARTTEEYGKHHPEFLQEAAEALDGLYSHMQARAKHAPGERPIHTIVLKENMAKPLILLEK